MTVTSRLVSSAHLMNIHERVSQFYIVRNICSYGPFNDYFVLKFTIQDMDSKKKVNMHISVFVLILK